MVGSAAALGLRGRFRVTMLRLAAAGLFSAAGLTGVAAQAPQAHCQSIETQLAALDAGQAGSNADRRAVATQRDELQQARQRAEDAGCGRSILSGEIAECARLNGTIARMQANLAKLLRGTGPGDPNSERARLEASLSANGCRTAPAFPGQITINDGRTVTVIDGRTSQAMGGRFRTLCVRTCDGYFFPISYGVASAEFARDERSCAAMCPGTHVELHYHPIPGGRPENMISVPTGRPYVELDSAFLHRRTDAARPAGCECQATASARGNVTSRGFEIIAGQRRTAMETPEPPVAEFNEAPVVEQAGPVLPEPAPENPEDRRVRVVGPAFFPDPEEAIDLRAPAPARAR
jgi:hypothetical protein